MVGSPDTGTGFAGKKFWARYNWQEVHGERMGQLAALTLAKARTAVHSLSPIPSTMSRVVEFYLLNELFISFHKIHILQFFPGNVVCGI